MTGPCGLGLVELWVQRCFSFVQHIIMPQEATADIPAFLFFPAKSSMFVESCQFEEENMCGMIEGAGNKKWERHASVDGGPPTDFSHMGECNGDSCHFIATSVTIFC